MARKARGWCDICRDEKPEVTCVEKDCRKSFHIDCLRNTGQLHEDDDFSSYLCPACRNNEENDPFCYKCKSEGDEHATLLMCDGCPRSAHLECIGLKDVPSSDTWMCPVCTPASVQPKETSKMLHAGGGRAKLGNVDICYVCQRGGKLLCCDLCDQSFHPKCIDPEFLESSLLEEGVWSCPICRGDDPLKHMSHKRLTRAARQAKSREWQQCVRKESRRCRLNRDLFLYESRNALRPFVTPDVIVRLRKSLTAAKIPLRNAAAAAAHPKAKQIDDEKEVKSLSTSKRSHLIIESDDDDDEPIGKEAAATISSMHYSEEEDTKKSPPGRENSMRAGSASETAAADESARAAEEQTTESAVLYQEEKYLIEAEERAAKDKVEILRENVELKNYQRWGINWLLDAFNNKAGAILADEMGLGKTIQTLAFLSALKVTGVSGPHLVVVPLSTVGNWAREIRKFTPDLSFTKICGSRQEREHSMADGVATDGIYDVFITTYETAVTEEWFFTDKFKWQCMILDEAHRIKNESARIRHSLDRVECNMRVLLTGTPLQNNIRELFTLLNFLFPDIIKSSSVVETVFQPASNGGGQKKSDKPGTEELTDATNFDESKIGSITSLLSKLMLRRTKDLVVRLPSKIDHDIWLPLSSMAATWYRKLLEVTANTDANSIRKLLGAVIKMRICCCHPRGLVSRPDQLKSLLLTIKENVPTCGNELESEAETLKNQREGWSQIRNSSKLLFLDKLLTQLHCENMRHSAAYALEYTTSRQNRLRQAIKSRREQLESLTTEAQKLPPDMPLPQEAVDLINKIEKELEILSKPEGGADEGGLDGLVPEKLAHISVSKTPDLFARHMCPADLTDDQAAAVLSGEGNSPKSTGNEDGGGKNVIRPHKVLVFTQFQLVLDELAAYCQWRGWSHMRLDGSTNKMIRELDTREFNSADSTHFVYLISTRAGGLGINLVTANHVVMYDEDWNPFVDLQAVDRAHRIGQVRNVHIWRLMVEWTVEERMAIRRQQKLKLDRLLIQANVVEDVDEQPLPGEKLSADEIRRLLQYGRQALLKVPLTDEIESMSLEGIAARKRRELKDLQELETVPTSSSSTSPGMDVAEVMLEEEGDRPAVPIEEDGEDSVADDGDSEPKASTDTTTPQTDAGVDDTDAATLELMQRQERPRRERRKPKSVYNPVLSNDRIKTEIKITREKKCFSCGGVGVPSWLPPAVPGTSSGQPKSAESLKKVSSATPEDSKTELLVGCMRCPKVYHKDSCLGLDKIPPKSWMCPWHECCLCFRRAASAGGLLMHCAECPTAFCFDCFPPEYRRYIPPPEFFEGLQKRGWHVTPQKLVTFLCSKCKALKEQERRRRLSRAQLDAEMKSRRNKDDSTRAEARKKQLQRKEERQMAKSQRQKQLDEKKKFFDHKKAIDEKDKALQEKLRQSLQKLYPQRYLDLLQERRQGYLDEHQQQPAKLPEESARPPAAEDAENDVKKTTAPTTDTTVTSKEAAAATKAPAKKRVIIPDRFKSPAETLKLCENCFLPLHELPQCPFPAELTRQKTEFPPAQKIEESKSAAAPENAEASSPSVATPAPLKDESTDQKTFPIEATPYVILDGSDQENAELKTAKPSDDVKTEGAVPSPDAAKPTEASKSSKPAAASAKPKIKVLCSVCQDSQSVPHSRRHCEKLTEEQKKEYEDRREKYRMFVEALEEEAEKNSESIQPPARLTEVWHHPDFNAAALSDKFLDLTRRQLGYSADLILQKIVRAVGLENCIPPSREFSAEEKQPKVSAPPPTTIETRATTSAEGTYSITNFLPSSQRRQPLQQKNRTEDLVPQDSTWADGNKRKETLIGTDASRKKTKSTTKSEPSPPIDPSSITLESSSGSEASHKGKRSLVAAKSVSSDSLPQKKRKFCSSAESDSARPSSGERRKRKDPAGAATEVPKPDGQSNRLSPEAFRHSNSMLSPTPRFAPELSHMVERLNNSSPYQLASMGFVPSSYSNLGSPFGMRPQTTTQGTPCLGYPAAGGLAAMMMAQQPYSYQQQSQQQLNAGQFLAPQNIAQQLSKQQQPRPE